MNKIGVGYASISDIEKKYVMDALNSEKLSSGKMVARFEKEFAKIHNSEYGVMCNSGTSAIHIALETLKEAEQWDETVEILIPSVTFISTSNACLHAGLRPVFVDVDRHSYNIDVNEIEKHITPRTKAIIPVHVFGLPAEMDAICDIARKYKLKIIEDCADAHFAKYKGQVVGGFGDMAAFSTYVAHTITTGIGGCVTTNNLHYAEILRSLVSHGRVCVCETCIASEPNMVCKKRLESEIDQRFTFERIGYSYRVGEIEGALGLAQIQRAEEIMDKRHFNAAFLTKELSPYQHLLQLPKYPEYMEHTFMMYPIVVTTEKFERKDIVEYLESNNIETRPMFPLLNQPIYKKIFGQIEDLYPVAKWINKQGFYIGCHHGLEKRDLDKIVKTIKSFLLANGEKRCI